MMVGEKLKGRKPERTCQCTLTIIRTLAFCLYARYFVMFLSSGDLFQNQLFLSAWSDSELFANFISR